MTVTQFKNQIDIEECHRRKKVILDEFYKVSKEMDYIRYNLGREKFEATEYAKRYAGPEADEKLKTVEKNLQDLDIWRDKVIEEVKQLYNTRVMLFAPTDFKEKLF